MTGTWDFRIQKTKAYELLVVVVGPCRGGGGGYGGVPMCMVVNKLQVWIDF